MKATFTLHAYLMDKSRVLRDEKEKARILTDPGQNFTSLQKQPSLFNYALTFTSLKSSEFVRRNTTVSE